MKRTGRCLAMLALVSAPLFAQDATRTVNFDTSRITLEVTNASVPDVVKAFAEQSGNPPFSISKKCQALKVILSVKDMPYWQALEKLCNATGLEWSGRTSRGTMLLRPALGGHKILGHAGPVVLDIWHIRRRRAFLPFGISKPMRNYLMYTVRYYWEDRLPVVASETWGTKIETVEGRDLIDDYATKGPRRFGYSYGHRGPPKGPGGFSVYVYRPSAGAKKLAAIEGFMIFEFASGEQEITLGDFRAAGAGFVSGNGLAVRLDKTWSVGNDQVATTTMRVGAGTAWPPLRSPPWGAFLVAPDGKRTWGMPTTTVPSLRDKLARVENAKAARPEDAATSEMQVSFRFYKLPPEVKHWKLVWVHPKMHEIRKYPFVIKDVPIR